MDIEKITEILPIIRNALGTIYYAVRFYFFLLDGPL